MATFSKRGERWRVQVRLGGVSQSRTFRTKAEASLWAARLETEISDKAAGKIIRRSVADTFDRYIESVCSTHKGERWEAIRLKMLLSYLPTKFISDITPADISELRDRRMALVSGSSVNRELNLLSAVFQAAIEWGWCRDNPIRATKRPKVNQARDRIISQLETDALIAALGYSEDAPVDTFKRQVAVMFLLALETGMRAGEIEALEWARVDLGNQYVRLIETKTVARDVPLSTRAVALLSKCRPLDKDRVFLVRGQTRDALFRKARADAGLDGFTFHDARHTAATRLAKVLDVLTLCKMFGWKNPKMAMVYYNPTASDIAKLLK